MESKRKRFGFLKEEQKCSDSSVVRGYISGLLRLVSKLSDITCTCLALDLVINARAGQYTDSDHGRIYFKYIRAQTARI